MKRRLLFIFVTVVLPVICCFGVSAADESVTDSTGTYQYTIMYSDNIRIDKVLTQPDSDFVIPDTVDGYKVYRLGDDIFNVDEDTNYSADIITVTLSDNLNSLNLGTFKNCANLEKYVVPDSNTNFSVDEYGVLFNKNMTIIEAVPANIGTTEYVIPDTVTSFYSAFFPPKIETLTIPESVTKFSTSAIKNKNQNKVKNLIIENYRSDWPSEIFSEWSTLETVTLGEKSECVGDSAFYGCANLKTVKGGENVKTIGAQAFQSCSKLTDVHFDNVTEMGKYAFAMCYRLASVPYGNKIESMGKDAFLNCYALTDVTIPASLTDVPDSAFWCCEGLVNLTIENGCKTIGNQAFYHCSIRDIFIPSSVETIKERAFYNQTEGKITSITLSQGVREIGAWAFGANNQYGCSNIVLPESLETIGASAFDNHRCSSITIPKNVRSVGADAFGSSHVTNFTLIVLSYDCVFDNDSDLFSGLNCKNVTIKAFPGSTAEEYVKNHPEYDHTSSANGVNTFSSLCDDGIHLPEKECSIYTECKGCGKIMSSHTDENGDDICDVCGKFCGKIDVDYSNGVLIIHSDCDNANAYDEFADDTKTIIFDNGVTDVSDGQFDSFKNIGMIFFSDSVKNVECSFVGNVDLKAVIFASGDTTIGDNIFGENIDMYVPNDSLLTAADVNLVGYKFVDGTLYMIGSVSENMYTYLDTVSAFTLMYDDIKSVYFEKFEAVGFTVYTYDRNNDTFTKADEFDDVTFSVMVETEDGERKEISYNELSEYLDDGKGTFYIVTETADGNEHDDTKVSIVDKINQFIHRILAAIVKLMNKIFLFFSKFK